MLKHYQIALIPFAGIVIDGNTEVRWATEATACMRGRCWSRHAKIDCMIINLMACELDGLQI